MNPRADPKFDLRSRVLGGFRWSVGTMVAKQLWRIVTAILLVRLLTPHDYGLAAMVLVFSGFALALSDLSLGAGLVQRARISEADRSTIFWTSATIGLVLTLVGIAVSGLVADFYGEAKVETLFAVVSLGFFVSALSTTQAAVLQREMNFRAIGLRGMAGTAVGGVLGIAAAAYGLGPWALIVQHLAAGVVSTTLLWVLSSWRPHFIFSLASLRDIGGFGLRFFGSRVSGLVVTNSDNVLIGRYLGSSALGAYSVAYNLVLVTLTRLTVPIQDTLFPALSRIQDDRERVASLWLRTNRVVAAVVMPLALGLLVVAPDFVPVVLGSQWNEAVPVVQILAMVAMALSMTAVARHVLAALNRVGTVLLFSIVTAVTVVTAFAVGLQWGVVGVASAYAIVIVPLQLLMVRLATRALGIPLRRVADNLAGVVQAAVIMLVVVLALRVAVVAADVPQVVRLISSVVVGAAAYVGACLWRAPDLVAEYRGLRRRPERPITADARTEPLHP